MLDSYWEHIKGAVWGLVWSANAAAVSPLRGRCLRVAQVAHMVLRELSSGQLQLWAMSLVYTTLLSLVPLLAVSFSVLKGFGVHDRLEPALLGILAPLGERATELTVRIVGFVDNVRVGLLGTLGLALLLYTVISLLQKVERAFNYTWRVYRLRPLGQRFSDYLSVLLVGPVLVVAALGLTATLASSTLARRALAIEPLGWVVERATGLLPALLIIAAFAFVYLFLPNTKVRLRPALVGATVAGVLWQLLGWGFATFVVTTTKTTAIYSSFAILVIFMLWLYMAWLILLVGASVAFYAQHPEYLGLLVNELRVSARMKDQLALACTFRIAQRHYYGLSPLPSERLADDLGVPIDPVREILEGLAESGILTATADGAAYVPARDLALISVDEVLAIVRRDDESPYLNPGRLKIEQPVNDLLTTLARAEEEALQGATLRDLAAANPPSGQAQTAGSGGAAEPSSRSAS